jgi:hypothetical protein
MSCQTSLPTIELTAGQVWDMPITFTNEAGAAVNLTGSTVHLMAKASLAADDDEADLDISQSVHTAAASGQTTLPIDLSDLPEAYFVSGGLYTASLWLVDSAENRIPYGLLTLVIKPSAKFKPDAE